MTFNGLPLHPLIVHLVVVATPLAAIGAVLYGVRPRWRWALRWPTAVTAVVAAISAQVAVMSGHDLKDRLHMTGPLIQAHETWAGRLQVGTWVLAAVVVIACLTLPAANRLVGGRDFNGRIAALRPILTVVLPLVGLVELYLVFRTGDAGAKVVYGSVG
ncbi:MAG TPA: DUF2231 domain-containing protein [Marmoricola sp.]